MPPFCISYFTCFNIEVSGPSEKADLPAGTDIFQTCGHESILGNTSEWVGHFGKLRAPDFLLNSHFVQRNGSSEKMSLSSYNYMQYLQYTGNYLNNIEIYYLLQLIAMSVPDSKETF